MGRGRDQVTMGVAVRGERLKAGTSTIDGGAEFDTPTLLGSDRACVFSGGSLFVGGAKIAEPRGFEALNQSGMTTDDVIVGRVCGDKLGGFSGKDTLNGLGGRRQSGRRQWR